MTIDTAMLGASVLAELLVAWVIYYEWEGGKLDRFLEDADKLAKERNLIYEVYCGLTGSRAKERSTRFSSLLYSGADRELQNACDENIRLVSRIGARLPQTPFFKRTPLEWHVAAILWIILESYVERRRNEAGRTYAVTFLRYALKSLRVLLKQKRNEWTVRDPNRSRQQDVIISRDEMEAAVKQIRKGLARKN